LAAPSSFLTPPSYVHLQLHSFLAVQERAPPLFPFPSDPFFRPLPISVRPSLIPVWPVFRTYFFPDLSTPPSIPAPLLPTCFKAPPVPFGFLCPCKFDGLGSQFLSSPWGESVFLFSVREGSPFFLCSPPSQLDFFSSGSERTLFYFKGGSISIQVVSFLPSPTPLNLFLSLVSLVPFPPRCSGLASFRGSVSPGLRGLNFGELFHGTKRQLDAVPQKPPSSVSLLS